MQLNKKKQYYNNIIGLQNINLSQIIIECRIFMESAAAEIHIQWKEILIWRYYKSIGYYQTMHSINYQFIPHNKKCYLQKYHQFYKTMGCALCGNKEQIVSPSRLPPLNNSKESQESQEIRFPSAESLPPEQQNSPTEDQKQKDQNIDCKAQSVEENIIIKLSFRRIFFPQEKDSIKKFKSLGKLNKKYYLTVYKKYSALIDEVTSQILEQKFTYTQLQEISQEQKIRTEDLVMLCNEQGETVLEMLLIYINDFDIILNILRDYQFEYHQYLNISARLFKKLRPSRFDKEIEKQIDFVKAIKNIPNIIVIVDALLKNNDYYSQNLRHEFDHYISYFQMEKLTHIKLLGKIAKVFKIEMLRRLYEQAQQKLTFKNLKMPKIIPLGQSDVQNIQKVELSEIKFNLFHQIALEQKWEIFVKYSNPYIQQPNISGITPFMLFFQLAPLELILEYIIQYQQQLDRGLQYYTGAGFNLLHCVCMNKGLSQENNIDNIHHLIEIFQENSFTKELLLFAYQDQIPAIFYLDHQKLINQQFLQFLLKHVERKFDFFKLDLEAQIISDEIKKVRQFSCQKDQRKAKRKLKQPLRKFKPFRSVSIPNQRYKQHQILYLHYIQLMKQIIRRKFSIQLPWLTEFNVQTSFLPYDISSFQGSILNLLYENDLIEQLKVSLDLIYNNIHQKLYEEKSIIKFTVQVPTDFSIHAQLIAKLIYLGNQMTSSSVQPINQQISNFVIKELSLRPDLLQQNIYGNSGRSLYDKTLFSIIYQMKEQQGYREYFNQLQVTLLGKLPKKFIENELFLKLHQIQVTAKFVDKICGFFPIQLKLQIKDFDWHFAITDFSNKLFSISLLDFYYLLYDIQCLDYRKQILENDPPRFSMSSQFLFLLFSRQSDLISKFTKIDSSFIGKVWFLQKRDKTNKIQYLEEHDFSLLPPLKLSQLKQEQFEQLFEWQLQRVDFIIYYFICRGSNLTLKQSIILYQLQRQIPFIFSLILHDDFHEEVMNYFKKYPKQLQLFKMNNFPLFEIIQNKAKKNLQLLSQLLKYSQFDLIQILSNTFYETYSFTSERIVFFNSSMQYLLDLYKEISEDCIQSIFFNLTNVIHYFENKIIDQLKYQFLEISFLNSEKKCFFLEHIKNGNILNRLFISFLNNLKKRYEFRPSMQILQIQKVFGNFLISHPNLAILVLQKLKAKAFTNKYYRIHRDTIQSPFIIYAQNNPIKCCQFLKKVSLSKLEFQFLEKYSRLNKHTTLQNYLIYCKTLPQYNAEYLAFEISTIQYCSLIETIQLPIRFYIKQLKNFIWFGLADKFKFLFSRLDNKKILPKIIVELIFMKQRCIENQFGFSIILTYQEQLYQKFFSYYFYYQHIMRDMLFSFGKSSFLPESQTINYLNILNTTGHLLKDSQFHQQYHQLLKTNTLLDLFINPNGTYTEQNQLIVDNLVQLFYVHKKSDKFIDANYDRYIDLIVANLQNCKLKLKFVFLTQYQKKFFTAVFKTAVITKNNVDYDSKIISQMILSNNLEDEQFCKVVDEGLKQYTLNIFSNTSLFYSQRGAELLFKDAYDLSSNRLCMSRLQQLKQWMSTDTFNPKKLSVVEFFLFKGRHDHLHKKISFSMNYLLASILSNNINSLIFVLDLNKNPVQLGFEQNIFQTLILYSNEESIIKYFKIYVDNKIKDYRRLLELNNVSILYYIAFKKYERVFTNVIMKCMKKICGKNSDIIDNEMIKLLQQKAQDNKHKIYQVALIQKSYFLLEYLNGIITTADLQTFVNHYDIGMFAGLKNYSIASQTLATFIKLSLKCQKINPSPKMILSHHQIMLEQTILFKLFNFNKQIECFAGKYCKFSDIIQLNFERILDQNKANPSIIVKYYKKQNNQHRQCNLTKNIIITLVKICQKYYLLQHKIFQTLINYDAKQMLLLLLPPDFTLDNCIIIGQLLQSDQGLKNLIQKQIDNYITKDPKSDLIELNALYILSLLQRRFHNNFDEFLKKYFKDISLQVLIRSNDLIQIYKPAIQEPILTKNRIQFIFSLISNKIEFEDQQQLIDTIIQAAEQYSILTEFILIRQIEYLVDTFFYYFESLSKQAFSHFSKSVKLCFSDIDISYKKQQFYLPITFVKGHLILNFNKIEEFKPKYKILNYQFNKNVEMEKFSQIQQHWEQFDLKSLLTKIDIANVPINVFSPSIIEESVFFEELMIKFEKVPENEDINDYIIQNELLELENTKNQQDLQADQQVDQSDTDIKSMKQHYDFILDLLPNNTYKVKQQERDHTETPLIFMEFYNFVNPHKTIINLEILSQKDFLVQYCSKESISLIITSFYLYLEKLKKYIKVGIYDQWNILFPYYLVEESYKYQKSLFMTYTIQVIFSKLNQLIDNVKYHVCQEQDRERINWRINAISVLEVLVSNIICFQTKDDIMNHFLSIIDSIIYWNSLILVLFQIIYGNILHFPNIANVLKRVYIEFGEVLEIPFNNSGLITGLDRQLQFGQTNYFLSGQTLIVRLNIKKRVNQLPYTPVNLQSSSVNFLENKQPNFYLENIDDEEDLLFQLFQPAQLITYLFNKFEIDKLVSSHSRKLSQVLNTNIVISINHQALINILSSYIQSYNQISDRQTIIIRQYLLKQNLLKLQEYFIESSYSQLINYFKGYHYEELFSILLSSQLTSLRQNINRLKMNISNTRTIFPLETQKVCEKLCSFNLRETNLISCYFGFQVSTSYFITNNSLGDICMVCYLDNYQRSNLISCQLVDNSNPGKLLFSKINREAVELLTNEQIQKNYSNYEQGNQKNSEELIEILYEDLQSVIVFKKRWAFDNLFNAQIKNIFVTDQNSNVYIIFEKKLLRKMISISESQNDALRQDLLDGAFGKGIISSNNQLAVTDIVQLFPNQILYQFSKESSDITYEDNINIIIDDINFIVVLLKMKKIKISCYFDCDKTAQQYILQLNGFRSKHKELTKISFQIIFDDSLDDNPSFNMEILFRPISVLEEFQFGLQEFLSDQVYPLLDNSLSYLFDISLTQIKKNVITNCIKTVQFIYMTSFAENKTLLELEKGNFKIHTIIDQGHVYFPSSKDIYQFLLNIIIEFRKFELQDLIVKNKNYDIVVQSPGQLLEFFENLAIMILLTTYLNQLLFLFIYQKLTFKLVAAEDQEKNGKQIYCYEFQKLTNTIVLYYDRFKDFSLSNFFLDFLNGHQVQSTCQYNDLNIKISKQILSQFGYINVKDIIFGEQQEEADFQLFISKNEQKIQQLEGLLNPKEFQKAFLFIKQNKSFKNLIVCVSTEKFLPLIQFCKQKTLQAEIGFPFYVLIKRFSENEAIKQQLKNIFVVTSQNVYKSISVYENEHNGIKISKNLISNNYLLLQILSSQPQQIILKSKKFEFSSTGKQDFTSQLQITFFKITNSKDLIQASHVGVLCKNIYKKITQLEDDKVIKIGLGDEKLIKLLFLQKKSSDDKILESSEPMCVFSESEFQQKNIFSATKKELSFATKCGDERTDFIEFQNIPGYSINSNMITTIEFVNSLFAQIRYSPKYQFANTGIQLTWNPKNKGIYHLYIEKKRILGLFVVLANLPSLEMSEIIFPDQLVSVPYYEEISFTYLLKDSYGNIYGNEEDQIEKAQLSISIPKSQIILEQTFSRLNKFGSAQGKIKFIPNNIRPDGKKQENCYVNVNQEEFDYRQCQAGKNDYFIYSKWINQKQITVKDISFTKRNEDFQKQLILPEIPKTVNISRADFFGSLVKLISVNLKLPLVIKFQNEPCSDYGGPKREFYTLIGDLFKDKSQRFFISLNQKYYYFHPIFVKYPKWREYAQLFGKLVANAMLNNEIIGIQFHPSFWKVLFGIDIIFEDLKDFLDNQTFNNYLQPLTWSMQQIESLQLNFTFIKQKEILDLIPGGSTVQVGKNNYSLYLKKIAEYMLKDQYKDIFTKFEEGFVSVLDLSILKKQFSPEEVHFLTQGNDEINIESIISILTFKGGQEFHKSFFLNYLSEMTSTRLKDLLQYITGSPYLHSTIGFKILIEFNEQMNETFLPTAQTCFYKVQVPTYKSYAIMKQKFDIALNFALYGFGTR